MVWFTSKLIRGEHNFNFYNVLKINVKKYTVFAYIIVPMYSMILYVRTYTSNNTITLI